MPSNRHNLILDEQAFQGLLSAAFIVQEYNDRLNNDQPNRDPLRSQPPKQTLPTDSETRPAPESPNLCRHCGVPKPAAPSRCQNCGQDELRPGERLQRNWASMWLMSQEQDLWSARSPEIRESSGKDVPSAAGERRPLAHSTRDSSSSGVVGQPAWETSGHPRSDTIYNAAAGGLASDQSLMDKSELGDLRLDKTLHNPVADAPAVPPAAAESKSTTAEIDATIDQATDEATDRVTEAGFSPQDSRLAVHTYQLPASDDLAAIEASADEFTALASDATDTDARDSDNRSWIQHWADLRVTLRFHRSNLYLAGAVLVAALALLWPTAGSPRRAVLSPWERALVTLGLAEAPEPAIHIQGDPGIEVWVDPHTALYYCPGEEQYGKTADGRLSSQHDAQMDRFEPAGRSVCD